MRNWARGESPRPKRYHRRRLLVHRSMTTKFLVEEQDAIGPGSSATRVFHVRRPGKSVEEAVHVWSNGGLDVGCTSCNSPLRAMSGSCRHAQAVKRFLRKSLAPATAPSPKIESTPESTPKAQDPAAVQLDAVPQNVADPTQRTQGGRPRRADLHTLSGLLKELETREHALLLETGTSPWPGSIRSTDKRRASALRRVLVYFGELPPE